MAAGIIGAAAGLAGLGTSIATGITGLQMSKKNFALQKQNLAYQQALQKQIFAREDTAYQRKVADLKAAGLNPVLAAGGSGSAAGSPISTSAPQQSSEYLDKFTKSTEQVQAALNMITQEATIAQTRAQTELTQMQKQKVAAEKQGVDIDNAAGYHDLRLAQRTGLPTKTGIGGSALKDAFGYLDQMSSNVKSVWQNIVAKIRGK